MKFFRVRGPVGNSQWWQEARNVSLIPYDQLPAGPQRDTLTVLAAFGEAQVYTPHGSKEWVIWFEQPVRERISIPEWLRRVEAQYR